MYIHKYKTEAGTAYLVSGSQGRPKANVKLADWEGRATGNKVEQAIKLLANVPVFKEEEPAPAPEEEKGVPKKASIADIVRSYVCSLLKTEE